MRTLLILSILLILVALGCTLAGEVGPEATKVFADLDALEKAHPGVVAEAEFLCMHAEHLAAQKWEWAAGAGERLETLLNTFPNIKQHLRGQPCVPTDG